jgi:hypothetical protein
MGEWKSVVFCVCYWCDFRGTRGRDINGTKSLIIMPLQLL